MTCKCGFRLNMPGKKCGCDGKKPEGDKPKQEKFECFCEEHMQTGKPCDECKVIYNLK